MSVWLVRAGSGGEYEDVALEENRASIAWREVPDIRSYKDRDSLRRSIEDIYPEEAAKRLIVWTGELWRFANDIKDGDIILMPLKSRPYVKFGIARGAYEYRTNVLEGTEHTRPVAWGPEMERERIPMDLLNSLGSTLTVARITRNDAERRFQEIMDGKGKTICPPPKPDDEGPEDEDIIDFQQAARDTLRRHIAENFKGHRLAYLVEGILIAQGYKTRLSPPGADGGVDILAGQGHHGLASPRLAVQVKSGAPVDVKIYRELSGIMDKFNADTALLVSFGGFRNSIPNESYHDHLRIRLWNDSDLIDALTEHFEHLPERLRDELPFKPARILVPT